jgi:hypothetical protein
VGCVIKVSSLCMLVQVLQLSLASRHSISTSYSAVITVEVCSRVLSASVLSQLYVLFKFDIISTLCNQDVSV